MDKYNQREPEHRAEERTSPTERAPLPREFAARRAQSYRSQPPAGSTRTYTTTYTTPDYTSHTTHAVYSGQATLSRGEYSRQTKPLYDLERFAASHSPDRQRPSHTSSTRQAKPLAEDPGDIGEYDDYNNFNSYDSQDYKASEPEPSLTGTEELPFMDEPDDFGYQSAYGPDDSGIVRESSPAAKKREESAAKAPPSQKRVDRRALLERRVSLVVAGILTLCFAGAALLLLVLPRSTKSMIEKRELATFPTFSLKSYFSGDFTAGVATFYDDTVPNRDGLKKAGSNFKAIFGLPSLGGGSDVEFVGNIQKVNENKPVPDPASAPEQAANSGPDSQAGQPADPGPAINQVGTGLDASLEGAAGRNMTLPTPEPAVNPFHQAEEANMTENGLIVVKAAGHYRGLELFGGGSGDTYAQALNNLHSQLGDSVQIWSMPAPLACEFYTPDTHQEYTSSQSDCFDKVHAKLDPAIHGINICGALERHVEEPIYCRTDHHWQPLGAYYAAQAFAQAAGVPFDDISTYTAGSFSGFVGSMYSFTESSKILNDPEDFTYYIPSSEYTATYYNTAFEYDEDDDDTDLFAQSVGADNAYMYYIHGDSYIVKANTQVQNGRKLLIIKDSYGNAEVPFYVGSFQQIFVADMRYLERNLVSFIRDMGITDVLFTMSSYSLVGANAENLDTLITQNAGETVVDPKP